MRHLKYLIIVLAVSVFASCNDFLDKKSDTVIDPDIVFGDEEMVKSVLSNLYDRTQGWDRFLSDIGGLSLPDESARSGIDNRTEIETGLWRVYDYTYIRNINQFLADLQKTGALSAEKKKPIEGEARFLRAYCYFQSVKTMGGVPLVGDVVYDYEVGQDVSQYHIARSTESASWTYIINEFEAAARLMVTTKYKNASRANKWAALAMKARSAVYAGSIAQHTATHQNAASLRTPGYEAGIPASEAVGFYQIALNAAEELIKDGGYILTKNVSDPAKAFYETTSVKTNNTEVIWALDRISPGKTTEFTNQCIPYSLKEDLDGANHTPLLNVVEDFEYIDGTPGTLNGIANRIVGGNNVSMNDFRIDPATVTLYTNQLDLFANKDPRLEGSIILPGAKFKGIEVPLQAGLALWDATAGKYKLYIANGERSIKAGSGDSQGVAEGTLIVGEDGPFNNSSDRGFENKTGFHFRKFLDETPLASVRGEARSAMWTIRFRLAEAYLIAAEAIVGGATSAEGKTAADYLNVLRDRAGIQALSSATFQNIVQEYRVELAFEDHRYWDARRWRIADVIWDGQATTPTAVLTALYPYKIYRPGHADNGKWVYVKQRAEMMRYHKRFKVEGYYTPVDQDWINKNPLLEKNPYQ